MHTAIPCSNLKAQDPCTEIESSPSCLVSQITHRASFLQSGKKPSFLPVHACIHILRMNLESPVTTSNCAAGGAGARGPEGSHGVAGIVLPCVFITGYNGACVIVVQGNITSVIENKEN